MFNTVNDLERVGDHAENIVELAEYRIDNKLCFSDSAIEQLKDMSEKVMAVIRDAITALETGDKKLARTIEPREEEIDELERVLRNNHIKRLNEGQCNPASGVIFFDIVNNLERVADHASNIAFTVIES